ncbi:hypothetical protein Patl1_22781 [Pistacia atlantica]|uniref:Uncharacterized protein n=1 Tax=Pistacia atlantica TaxID=434234 RepID=A0ACC1A382_9ROSI|nr:hypothetical protein Patl1_22781 [Pistacia atlantica]
MLKLKLNSSICWEGIARVSRMVEDLRIDEWHGENVLYALDREGFVELKHLHVQNSAYFLCIIDSIEPVSRDPFPLLESLVLNNLINLEKICHSQFTTQSFCKLRIMNVIKCENMEEIFSIGREDDINNELSDKIEFGQLRFLTLKVLPQFKSFCSKVKTPSTSQNVHRECTTGAISSEIVVEDEIDTLTSLFNEKVN